VQGEFFQVDSTLDEKGRLLLPARLRKKLAAAGIDTLVFLYYPGMGIFGYTPDEWHRQVVGRIQDADSFHPDVLTFVHGLVAGAATVEVDKQGRLLIPPKLRAKAGIDRAIILQALMGRLEVWDARRWAEREAAAEAAVPALHGTPSVGKGA
jgi:MraZ protein